MSLGTNDMQTAQLYDMIMILFALTHLPLEQLILLSFGHIVEILLDGLFFFRALILVAFRHLTDVVDLLSMFAQDTIEVPFGISTKHNVGTTASHVGSYSNGATTPGLGNDLCFTCMVFRIEHIMRDTLLIQLLGNILRVLHRSGANQHGYARFV